MSTPQALLPNRPGFITAVELCASRMIAIFLLCAIAHAFGQAASPSAATTDACTDLEPGIVVESVAKNSEAEKAGLSEGMVILSWSRGDSKGEIRSPFDLSEIEIEQTPRGQVTLEGTRGTAKQTWVMGPDKWGVTTRPHLPEAMLAEYRERQQLAKAGKLLEATDRWKGAVAEGQKQSCSWLNAWLLLHAAEALARTGEWKGSDALYKAAIERIAESDPRFKAQVLRAWADTFHQRGDLAKAEEYGRQTLDIWEKLAPSSIVVADNLYNLGNVVEDRGDLDTAEEYGHQALVISAKLAPGSLPVARSLINLSNIAEDRGDLAKAEEYQRQALDIWDKLAPGSLGVAQSLNNLGLVAYYRGDLAKAEEYGLQALVIKENLVPGSRAVAATLNNLGLVAEDRGDLIKAEEYYRKVLVIMEQVAPGSREAATSLNNLGAVAENRGDLARAEEYHRRALVIWQQLAPSGTDVARSLNNLGVVAEDQGNLAKAEEYQQQALAVWEKVAPGSIDVAQSLNNLSVVAEDRGDLAKAEEYQRQALVIWEKQSSGSLRLAYSLNSLGEIMSKRRDLAKSEEYYRQALDIRRKLAPQSADYAESLAGLAKTLRDLQNPGEAAKLYAEAVDVFDRQLSHLGGSSDVRAGFRAKHARFYSDYVDLLIAQKKPELAFQVMERSRARTLLETLAEGHIDIRQGADPAVIEKERLLQATLTSKTNRKINLLEGEHTDEQLAAVNKEIAEALARYQDLQSQIRSSSPKYAGLTQPKLLTSSEVQQQLLDAGSVLLEYAFGTEHSFVFVVTPTSLESFELPKRAGIETTARHLYDLLTSRNRWVEGETGVQRMARLAKNEAEYEKTAFALSQMVLGPVAKQVEGKRLLIVADGALHYIPFGVLPVPDEDQTKPAVPLVAEHEIVNLPSASVLAVLLRQAEARESKPTRQVAVLADPVFDNSDPRVKRIAKPGKSMLTSKKDHASEPRPSSAEHLTRSLEDVGGTRQAGMGLSRLAFSRREAAAIMAVTKPGHGMEALDFHASRETATSKDLSQYRIVHFATHGLLDSEHPEFSGLVLSMVGPDGKPQNGFLDLEDIYNLTLTSDLVVLSACETGLGKEINGEGLVGLTRGFMYAGASRVVASLWQVDDAATAELMGAFYKAMLAEGLRPAAALRQAQLELMKQKRWHDPYYWAAFTLQGEWK